MPTEYGKTIMSIRNRCHIASHSDIRATWSVTQRHAATYFAMYLLYEKRPHPPKRMGHKERKEVRYGGKRQTAYQPMPSSRHPIDTR